MGKGPLRGADAIRAVETAPEGQLAQVVDGVLHTAPRPRLRHSTAAVHLTGWLVGSFGRGTDGPGGWAFFYEPELHLGAGPDIVVPDLAGYRRETASEFGDRAFLDVVPDWVCEVLSPSTAQIDRVGKLRVYAREGAAHVWLVDPAARTLEVLALEGDGYRLVGSWAETDTVRAPPFEGGGLPLALLWEA